MAGHFTAIKFRNYKAFRHYSVALAGFNLLVGPNNAGTSTVIGALRILYEGIRKARSRKAVLIDSAVYRGYGYRVDLEDLPISTENVFTDYDDSQSAEVEFFVSSGGKLRLIFPESDSCLLVPDFEGKSIRSPSEFNKAFDVKLAFVPVLGPVEHNEPLFQEGAARNALQTHRASRNFRNIWYHYPESFEEFRELIQQTWPGMDIRLPEMVFKDGGPKLYMFCPEERVEREIFWSGFGFQVWCQMLTFIAKAPADALLIIDEPDIYLHSDLQRQLIHILKSRDGDVIIATHSTEMLSEAESNDIVVMDKRSKNSRRVSKNYGIQHIFSSLGSKLNPILTQLSKTKRVVFVEGADFAVLAGFARKLGAHDIANQTGFAIVPAHGFNPSRVRDFSEGMEATLGFKTARAVIFDRDYRVDAMVDKIKEDLLQVSSLVHVHHRKELENFLLVPSAIDRAIVSRVRDREKRGGRVSQFSGSAAALLSEVSDSIKGDVFGQYSSRHLDQIKMIERSLDSATIGARIYHDFEQRWADFSARLEMVPGKLVLSKLNDILQERCQVSITTSSIISAMTVAEVPGEMRILIDDLRRFSCADPPV